MPTYLNQPCNRCGSKRYTAKSWQETRISLMGEEIVVDYTQIDCVNKTCQANFEKTLLEEEKKRKITKEKKEANDLIRKEIMARGVKVRKNK